VDSLARVLDEGHIAIETDLPAMLKSSRPSPRFSQCVVRSRD